MRSSNFGRGTYTPVNMATRRDYCTYIDAWKYGCTDCVKTNLCEAISFSAGAFTLDEASTTNTDTNTKEMTLNSFIAETNTHLQNRLHVVLPDIRQNQAVLPQPASLRQRLSQGSHAAALRDQ